MRNSIPIFGGLLLLGCDQIPKTAARESAASINAGIQTAETFPVEGNYHIIRDRTERGQLKREEVDMWVDASNREAFEELVAGKESSRCRDRQVSIGDGQFNVTATCDAPDGDINNIRVGAHGSYSKDSIDISTETNLWGYSITETASYKLKN